ncbi:MAG: LPS export ABC transporter permease LptF [Acidiferrobacterales bacterium]
MIIHRSFYREATVSTLATILVLAILVFSQKAVFVLSSAASGGINAIWVASLLTLEFILDFDLLMQLSLFVGILVTLNRWYRDSEMVVLTSCGIGIMDLVRPVMVFTLGFAVVVGTLVLVIRPAAYNRIQEVKQENANKADLGWIVPGRFTSIEGYTYYVQKRGEGGSKRDVFIFEREGKSLRTIVAEKAKQVTNARTGQKIIRLNNGSIYHGQPGSADYRVTRFDEYEVFLAVGDQLDDKENVEGISIFALPTYPDRNLALTELQTRLGKPVMLFIFAGIAMLLSYSEPRRSQYRSLFIAVFVFFFYLTVLQYVRDMMRAGEISPVVSMWLVHAAAAGIIYYLLRRRNQGLPLLAWPRRQPS